MLLEKFYVNLFTTMDKPVIKITISYIFGIILGYYLNPSLYLLFGGIITLFIISIVLLLLSQKKLITLSLLSAFILIGFLYYEIATYTRSPRHLVNLLSNEKVCLTGVVCKDPDVRRNKVILVIKPERLANFTNPKGLVQATVYNPSFTFHFGDRIKLTTMLYLPKRPKKTDDFDYRSYLARKNIYALGKASGEEVTKLGRGKVNPILGFAMLIKHKMIEIIRRTMPEEASSLLLGIMLGEQKVLSYKLRQIFMETGVFHILAVSGLHVGLVGFIVFGFGRKILRFPRKFTAGLTIFSIVLYTLITGLRPSVVRAGIMAAGTLSCLLIDRSSGIYNRLSLACLIILLANPKGLFDVGFQLSFIATFGIIYLTTYFDKCFRRHLPLKIEEEVKSQHIRLYLKPLFKWIGVMLMVSISAQLTIIPLLSYYFQRIPLYSVVANLWVVPLVGVLLGLGFATIILSPISLSLAKLFGGLNSLVVMILIKSVQLISNIPHASINPPEIFRSEMVIFGYYSLGILFTELHLLHIKKREKVFTEFRI
ncbi:MAG: ComEC/Rec2 family competence protein [bacterium]|nr:ComEC/Rec2 family competence protein [bacterium]